MQEPKANPAALSDRLRELRHHQKWSLDDLSKALVINYGLKRTRQNLHQHETGSRIPSSNAVAGYCRVYNLNTEESQELYKLAGYVVVFAVEEG